MQKRVKYYQKRLKNGLKGGKIQVKKRKNRNENIGIGKNITFMYKN